MLLSMVHLTIYILALLIPDVDLNLTLIEYAMVFTKEGFRVHIECVDYLNLALSIP